MESDDRKFLVHSEPVIAVLPAKHPRDAATKALNQEGFEDAGAVEVFEIGRGKRYVRQSTAAPAPSSGDRGK